MPPKRKKESESGLESIHTRLTELCLSYDDEEEPVSPESVSNMLREVITTIESQYLNIPRSITFTDADQNTLAKFNIHHKGVLYLRPLASLSKEIATARTAGSDNLWSNETMYKHLSFLSSSFTHQNETSNRTVIDTFFFRATAMVPPEQRVIMMLENNVSSVQPMLSQLDTVSGVIDYTALVTAPFNAEKFLLQPPLINRTSGEQMVAFFVAEAKAETSRAFPGGHFPQAVLELIACAKHLGKLHIRGALTTGFKWHFIAVDLDPDGNGAKYLLSRSIEWSYDSLGNGHDGFPTIIAGILSSWIPQSFMPFKEDVWFSLSSQ